MFGFQRLEIYQLSKEIVKIAYSMTRKFPNGERYALVQQMNRAAVSISSNIAEGTSRASNKEQAYFISIAYGSLMELICQSEIAYDMDYISALELDKFIQNAEVLSIKMSKYKKYLREKR